MLSSTDIELKTTGTIINFLSSTTTARGLEILCTIHDTGHNYIGVFSEESDFTAEYLTTYSLDKLFGQQITINIATFLPNGHIVIMYQMINNPKYHFAVMDIQDTSNPEIIYQWDNIALSGQSCGYEFLPISETQVILLNEDGHDSYHIDIMKKQILSSCNVNPDFLLFHPCFINNTILYRYISYEQNDDFISSLKTIDIQNFDHIDLDEKKSFDWTPIQTTRKNIQEMKKGFIVNRANQDYVILILGSKLHLYLSTDLKNPEKIFNYDTEGTTRLITSNGLFIVENDDNEFSINLFQPLENYFNTLQIAYQQSIRATHLVPTVLADEIFEYLFFKHKPTKKEGPHKDEVELKIKNSF